jgi:Glycosyl transferase family 2
VSAPTVSAVVTAHDRRIFLAEAVASALASGADEVLVVRNFSGPIEGAEGRYRDLPCSDPETGVKEAIGVENAVGDLVAFLDDDDLWEPGKVARLRELFGADRALAYYCHDQLPVDAAGLPVTARHREWARKDPGRLSRWDGSDFAVLYQQIWPGNNSSTVVRRSWASSWTPALREAGWGADSFWLTAALLSRARWRLDTAPLTRLRLHGANMSQTRGATPAEFRARHAESCTRFSRSWSALARAADPQVGADAPLARYLRGKALTSEFLAELESGAHPRSSALRFLRRRTAARERGVAGTALVAMVSPGLARQLLYRSAQRRWELEPPDEVTRRSPGRSTR